MTKGRARAGFDLDLKYGQEAENKLRRLLGATKIEVKRDERAIQTGNLFVEYGKIDRFGDLVDSGINVTEAEWYAWVFRPNRFLIMLTEDLLGYTHRAIAEGKTRPGGDNNLTMGALVPLKWVIKE